VGLAAYRPNTTRFKLSTWPERLSRGSPSRTGKKGMPATYEHSANTACSMFHWPIYKKLMRLQIELFCRLWRAHCLIFPFLFACFIFSFAFTSLASYDVCASYDICEAASQVRRRTRSEQRGSPSSSKMSWSSALVLSTSEDEPSSLEEGFEEGLCPGLGYKNWSHSGHWSIRREGRLHNEVTELIAN